MIIRRGTDGTKVETSLVFKAEIPTNKSFYLKIESGMLLLQSLRTVCAAGW